MESARYSLLHLFAIVTLFAVAFACFRINYSAFWISFAIKVVGSAFMIGAFVILWRRMGVR